MSTEMCCSTSSIDQLLFLQEDFNSKDQVTPFRKNTREQNRDILNKHQLVDSGSTSPVTLDIIRSSGEV